MKLASLIYYCGPNRRSEDTMIEALLAWKGGEPQAIAEGWATAAEQFGSAVRSAGAEEALSEFEFPAEPGKDALSTFCRTASAIALQLQRYTGHEVSGSLDIQETGRQISRFVFEHDDYIVGQKAAMLTLRILAGSFPGLEIDHSSLGQEQSSLANPDDFEAYARERVQPKDTSVIISAARQQGVPVIKLERGPYEGARGDFRLRMNSMLMLGHTHHLQVIDGTFAIEKSAPAYALIFDRQKVLQAAQALDMPMPASGRDMQPLISAQRAKRVADDLGYPVVIKTANRRKRGGTTLNISHPEQIAEAVAHVQKFDQAFVVEKFIPGKTWKLLVANHELIAIIDPESGPLKTGDISEATMQMAVNASRALNVGLLELTLVTSDLSSDLEPSVGVVVDFEMSPRLDELLADHPEILEAAADRFVRWLIPAGEQSRVPTVAVTGTNGKSTVSRMVTHIMKAAGKTTGLQCTDGRFIGDEMVEEGDNSILAGHYRVFEDKSVDFAILETHLRGIAVYGFAYDYSDVGICTNITEDHLGEELIDTLDEVASIKQEVVARARKAAVLNADDPRVLAMQGVVKADTTFLTSVSQSSSQLGEIADGDCSTCTVEQHQDEDGEMRDWITISDGGRTIHLMPIDEVPATFGGVARFNVSNVLQAIAAAHAMGESAETIRSAMSGFEMNVESTPWRLNYYPGLPFQLLVDYAHNTGGAEAISEMVAQIDVAGKKWICIAGHRSDEQIRNTARAIAGHFDQYVLKDYIYPAGTAPPINREPGVGQEILASELESCGVERSRIHVIPNEWEALDFTMDQAEEGDFLLLLPGKGVLPDIPDYLEKALAKYQG